MLFKRKEKLANASVGHRSNLLEIGHRYTKNKAAMLGLIMLLIIIAFSVCADLIVPYEVAVTNVPSERLMAPCHDHILGTDQFGRDVLARILHGSRTTLSVAFLCSLLITLISCVIGAAAAYYGGWFDDITMRLMDIALCIPMILLTLIIIVIMGGGMVSLFVGMTIVSIAPTVRLIRSVVLTVTEQDFVKAARSYGARDSRIIWKYILPNALGPIIVDMTMGVSEIILAIAGFSYLGVGIQPPAPEWGAMLSDVKSYLRTQPYLLMFPGIAILLTALAFNLMGDGLRDALDPRLKK